MAEKRKINRVIDTAGNTVQIYQFAGYIISKL